MMRKHYNIRVEGKVQGVWFRKYTRDKALETGIDGYVENRPDGSVYIEAESTESVLKEFTEWLYEGSPLSEVQTVIVSEAALENFRGFTIRK